MPKLTQKEIDEAIDNALPLPNPDNSLNINRSIKRKLTGDQQEKLPPIPIYPAPEPEPEPIPIKKHQHRK